MSRNYSPRVLKELSRKAIALFTYLFDASLKLEHVSTVFKSAEVITLEKKEAVIVQSSLLISMSKLY